MSPPSNKIAVGALWYKTMLQDSICPETNKNPLTMKYSQKTDGWETGSDSLNWAVVLPESGAGRKMGSYRILLLISFRNVNSSD